jgi:SAM-dependent methyltransferase
MITKLQFTANSQAWRLYEPPLLELKNSNVIFGIQLAPSKNHIGYQYFFCAPLDKSIPYQFELPSFERPVSQLCTHNQFGELAYATRCTELQVPMDPHRKYWEWCFILQAMYVSGVIAPGKRALAFGAGQEPLPSLLASRGVTVVATDAPTELDGLQGWQTTGQHSKNALDLHVGGIVPEKTFLDHVSFRPVDMNDIPHDLVDFDVCWSSCSFEHLGSIDHGLQFVENSLRCLRPGGVAIHTTEFNLDSNEATFESESLSLFRKQDFERLVKRLVEAGHDVWPLNFHPGFTPVDEVIDLPPYALPHLKLELLGITSTSVGIVVRKNGPSP